MVELWIRNTLLVLIHLRKMNIKVNFSASCRLCLKSGESRNICEIPYYIITIQKLTSCLLQDSDVLPKKICNVCCIKLDEISQFIDMCNETNATLNALYGSNILKTDNVESVDVKDPEMETNDEDVNDPNIDDIDTYDIKKDKFVSSHNSTQENEVMVLCSVCSWVGVDDKQLKEHEKEHFSSLGRWKCVDCEKSYTKKYDLVRHRQAHTGKKIYECHHCGEGFTQSHAKKRHIIAKHSTDTDNYKFECYICGQISKRKDNLEAHMLSIHIRKQADFWNDELHSGWNCKICGKSFSLYSYLEHHSLIHEGKKQKRTRKKSNRLKISSQSLSPSLCSICGKSFNKRKTYLGHMRAKHSNKSLHTDIKKDNYQCWQCGRIFSVLSNMKRHIRVHTGEKPYICNFCGRKFAQHNSWHDHENIHTGTKPYKCDHCHKSFTQRPSLKKHLRSSIHRKIC